MNDLPTTAHIAPPLVVPFIVLLLGIAILPLAAPRWWAKNSAKAVFVAIVAIPAAAILATKDLHFITGAAEEFASFIVLLGSLYVVTGGIVIAGDLRASPARNTAMLAIGSVLASLIGTTGASMLLIRPLLRANRTRSPTRHIPIFFIFIVANAGGLLTPLGDPPLFLGFLRGVPFTWTLKLFPAWIFVNGLLLLLFFLVDWRATTQQAPQTGAREPFAIRGLLNIPLLGAIVAAAAAAPPLWREVAMVAAAMISLFVTSKENRDDNGFTFHPIAEVAILFAGIFITMQPALALLREAGPNMGITTPMQFFFVSGALSSLLDNAPTYLTFFTVAQSLPSQGAELVANTGVPEPLLRAISLGSVLMGANTYIGNGPNFMVKSICDDAKLETPSFFGYMAWSALILGPIWLCVGVFFV